MNVVIYARYSSHNQTHQSIEGQLKECYEYAKRNGYNVIKEYVDEATTGTNDNREQFQQMIEDSANKQFNGILVYQLDRFARNRYDSAIHKKKLKDRGIRVFSVRENISEDASGVLMESVLEGMAEYFSLELGQKVKRGMAINASKCLYNGGTIPLGFKLEEAPEYFTTKGDKVVKKYKFAIDEENSHIVVKIFDMYKSGMLMAEIIRSLNSKQFTTAYNNEFNKNSIRNILLNKRYIGIYTYNGKETKNGLPKIIDEETFEKVQEMMKKNRLAPARGKAKSEYLLTTKLFCGHCKEMMTGKSGTSKTKKLHTYYACKNAVEKRCDKKYVKQQFIEDLVVKKAREILTDENIILIANAVVEYAGREQDHSNLKRLLKSLKANEKGKANLVDKLKKCEIDSVCNLIFEEISKMEEENKLIQNEIAIEESNLVEITFSQVKFFLTQMRKGNVDDIKYRKLLIDVLINKVYLYDDRIIGIFNVENKQFDININDIESSLNGKDALPLCIQSLIL